VQENYVQKQKARIDAIKELEKTVALDDGIGMFHIGRKYLDEYKLCLHHHKNDEREVLSDCAQKAVEWFEKGSKLKAGNYLCTAGFAYCYQEGIGKRRNDAAAKKRYSLVEKELKARADEGDMYSAYFMGEYNDVLREWAEKEKWLTKAAQLGHPTAQCDVAHIISNQLLNEKNMSKDFNRSEKVSEKIGWLNMAAGQNYARGLRDLAFEYYWGKDIPQDKAKAKELYEKAAELGCETSMMILGTHPRLRATAYVFPD